MVASRERMRLETLSDVRAEIARRRLTHQEVAKALGSTGAKFSHLMGWEEAVRLTDEGARMFADAIEAAERAGSVSEAKAGKR